MTTASAVPGDDAAKRTFTRCTCGNYCRRDLAIGYDGIARCGACGAVLEPTTPGSVIVGRHAYTSASLRRQETPNPGLQPRVTDTSITTTVMGRGNDHCSD